MATKYTRVVVIMNTEETPSVVDVVHLPDDRDAGQVFAEWCGREAAALDAEGDPTTAEELAETHGFEEHAVTRLPRTRKAR